MDNVENISLRITRVSPPCQPLSSALQRADAAHQQQLENYQIMRALALRGELEAFVAMAALDFEQNEQTFDRTLEIEGAEWLKRGGAL